jgi:hypothetical protein
MYWPTVPGQIPSQLQSKSGTTRRPDEGPGRKGGDAHGGSARVLTTPRGPYPWRQTCTWGPSGVGGPARSARGRVYPRRPASFLATLSMAVPSVIGDE